MAQYINKLPAVFQTTTEKKFFDATFDQVFSKKDTDYLAGYLGRRLPGAYNPISDFYIPEPSKNRTWWQLEPTAFARNADTTKTDVFFYEDLLDYIEYYGGNIQNQDRIFSSEYYSWAPPIDVDMFINYQNYYWVEQGLASIDIRGVTSEDVLGQSSYTTPSTASPPNVTLTTGMSIRLLDDPEYSQVHTVENIGGCTGIRLVPRFPDFTAGTIFEFLPWDGVIELSTGRLIDNRNWDNTTWDTQTQPASGDYITIERGSLDRNAWSRTNKWFHIDAINQTISITGSNFPVNSTRALRPIIQFIADLNLYKSGTQFRSEITYGFRDYANDQPIRLLDLQSRSLSDVNSELGTNISNGTLVCFFNDDTQIAADFPWDIYDWDDYAWDGGEFTEIRQYIFVANEQSDGSVVFAPYTAWDTPILEGDIVFILQDAPFNGALRGETWYYEQGQWNKAFNDKVRLNQPPLFQLYDHRGIRLDDSTEYPDSSFLGSKIFSYKVNTVPGATVDPVLKFPIVYTSLGQSSDIVFENNLMTDRYVYSEPEINIDGYYYYKTSTSRILYNNWNLYSPCPCDDIVPPPPCNCVAESKQRVIDKFVVGYGTEYQFRISVTPYGYPASPDIIVSVNGNEVKSSSEQSNGYTLQQINNRVYVNLSDYLEDLTIDNSNPPVVEVQTYTYDILPADRPGYFQIPQQLEANALQEEVYEITASNLYQHFSSIIEGQIGIIGSGFGAANNYRDTRKNLSVGQFILQNTSPLLKSMLVANKGDLELIPAIRFSQDEYTKFKNRYINTAKQMIDQEFNTRNYFDNTIVVSFWVDEILKRVNVSKEFSNSFAYSYMVANGSPFATEEFSVPVSGTVTLTNYLDLSLPENALYFYDVTGQERLLTIDKDYKFVSNNLVVEVEFFLPAGKDIIAVFYQNPLPAYIPSTPSKVGSYPVTIPRIELDTSFINPAYVIIGHDGSKTIAYGDYRDNLILELETRIYNLIVSKFRNQYYLPLRIENVKPGYFRETRYSREEYLDITRSYLNKWSAKNRANYRANDWANAIQDPAVDPDPYTGNIWKLYNYRLAENTSGSALNLPGNWKGIFQYYYDTIYPNTRPWEMLGFSQQPDWWVDEYGPGILNSQLEISWPSTVTAMWQDIEQGIIRQGPCAVYDPDTEEPVPQAIWARPGLSSLMPVDSAGDIISVMSIFDVVYSGNPYAPFDNFDIEWQYGDGSPVEQAWISNSAYPFSVQEILYLTQTSKYGEYFWDTVGTEFSPGMIQVSASPTPVRSSRNWQWVQNDFYTGTDNYFAWMRPKNKDQLVHAEIVDNQTVVRYGYQRWISDQVLFLGKSVGDTFGQKIRTLGVNLANKFAGFTNKDTIQTYIESSSPGNPTGSLIIPSVNYQVQLHSSPVVDTYSYSGVIVRTLEDGTFAIYGYDLLSSEFKVLGRSDNRQFDISVGGTPAEFKYFESGQTYKAGEIVRYNGVYYMSLTTQFVSKFEADAWKKLKALPIVGGVSVTYRPDTNGEIVRVPYGSVLKTVQEVFDLLIGWGDYLATQGWSFEEVNQVTNQVDNWLASAKQFLFWLNTNWAPDSSIQLSPLANRATLTVSRGYPLDVESLSNGVYSILDKFGVAIPPTGTVTERDGRTITVATTDVGVGGIYYLQINASEYEHIIMFDNITNFNDAIYLPLIRARQQRIRFNGYRSNGWYGKLEAPGYLVIEDELVPNYDTIVNSMRYFYDANVTIDNPSIEELGRHLIGYESKSYLDNLEVSNDVQYLFYKGLIRQKGTQQAFDKLFRSTKIRTTDDIEVYEEWALKLGDFGNTIEQVSTEFVLSPEQNTGDVIVARLNYKPSNIGFISQINIFNAENTYKTVPKIVVAEPNYLPPGYVGEYTAGLDYFVGSIAKIYNSAGNPVYYRCEITVLNAPASIDLTKWTLVLETRRARAYSILDSQGRISRIDISDSGYGYSSPVSVSIDSPINSNGVDKLYSVFCGEIVKDPTLDNVIDIDIDQTDVWTVTPAEPEYSLVFPETAKIEYAIPNAGYVNFKDVDFYTFDPTSLVVDWGSETLNPGVGNTVWVANNYSEDWSVYTLQDITFESEFAVTADENGNIFLRTPGAFTIGVQESTGNTVQTDFGNIIVLQVITAELKVEIDLTTESISNITVTKSGAGYKQPPMVTILGGNNDAVARAIIRDGRVIDIEIIDGGTGFTTVPNVVVSSPETLAGDTNYALAFEFDYKDEIEDYNYYQLQAIDGTPLTADQVPVFADFSNLLIIKQLRFDSLPTPLPDYVGAGSRVWIDNYNNTDKWSVINITNVIPSVTYSVYRQQEKLIDTALFKSASIYSTSTLREIVQLSIYDPFKGIFVGPAKQNISYISLQDPARYNITPNPRLLSQNITFGPAQVGKLWWDTSRTRFTYYEQPRALDETSNDNLAYRRDNWGRIFPGSQVLIYEWTESDVPPSEYTGTGTPRSTDTYVQIITSNRFTNRSEVKYYFWVLDQTDVPGTPNRTMAAQDVARLLQSPKTQGFAFFAPIRQDETYNSYMFYNVQEILVYQGNNVQIEYRVSERDDQKHTQWQLFREADSECVVTDQFWNKLVDSICGYTRVLPLSDEYSNSIVVGDGEVLVVPDPTLSEEEKYGIGYRPRQGMFKNIYSARKVFVQAANSLLAYNPIRDDNPSWSADVPTSIYWDYTTWYAPGYENCSPTNVYSTLTEANLALSQGQLQKGNIVKVLQGTSDSRFKMYAVVQEIASSNLLTLKEVAIENSAIKLLDTVYTLKNVYGLSKELRELMQAFRTQVMIDEFFVDQNRLFSAMLNYVFSEQKDIDWAFKTSYIYIKEAGQPLLQDRNYRPDQTESIIKYVTDSKPYHTKIRDYTTTYRLDDTAIGTAQDSHLIEITLEFGPAENPQLYLEGHVDGLYGWDLNQGDYQMPWQSVDILPPDLAIDGNQELDNEHWDSEQTINSYVNQYASGNPVKPLFNPGPGNPWPDNITVEITSSNYDNSKRGFSSLYPYTFNILALDSPQSVIIPSSMISASSDGTTLIYGRDYFVNYNNSTTNYTIYFFENYPATSDVEIIVWFNGGNLSKPKYTGYRDETARGDAADNLTLDVDTKLPVNDVGGLVTPYVGYGEIWESVVEDSTLGQAIDAAGGSVEIPWDAELDLIPQLLDDIISYKENHSLNKPITLMRKAAVYAGRLAEEVFAPTSDTENVNDIIVEVDPITHPLGTNILPNPISGPAVIWIAGERIEYKDKQQIDSNTWILRLVARGTFGTAATDHMAGEYVWVEQENIIPDGANYTANKKVWNLLTDSDQTVSRPEGEYNSVDAICPVGGLWYSYTTQADFLKDRPAPSDL